MSDRSAFVDANDNAVKLFKLSREELLAIGPEALSPEYPERRVAVARLASRLRRARAERRRGPCSSGCTATRQGNVIPCEVRFIQLPSSKQRLIRASIIDIAARRQADTLAYGERRVLELIAANAPLERTLQAVVRLVEQLHPAIGAVVTARRDADRADARGRQRPCARRWRACSRSCRSGSSPGACGVGRVARSPGGRAATSRGSAVGGPREPVPLANGVRACCSTPIVTSGDRIHGTLAFYFDAVRSPNTEELDLVTRLTQLAGIAIRRKLDETALRDSEARFRALFDNVVDGVYQATPSGELLSVNPALVRMLGYDDAARARRVQHGATLFVEPKERDAAGQRAHELRSRAPFRVSAAATRSAGSIVVVENSRVVTATRRARRCTSKARSPTSRSARPPSARCSTRRSARRSRSSRSATRWSRPTPPATSST